MVYRHVERVRRQGSIHSVLRWCVEMMMIILPHYSYLLCTQKPVSCMFHCVQQQIIYLNVDVHVTDYTDSHFTVSGKCYQMSSFCESKAEKLIESNAKDFVAYNSQHLSRIYPSGTRTGSSNYKPIPFWNVGCQMGTSMLTHHAETDLHSLE
jgi:hypothetical protein